MTRLLVTLLLLLGSPVALAACDGTWFAGRACDRPLPFERERIAPGEPPRARAGTRPGFVDVGGGTELRVGGRTRFEYQRTR